jgi:hypothetical protein
MDSRHYLPVNNRRLVITLCVVTRHEDAPRPLPQSGKDSVPTRSVGTRDEPSKIYSLDIIGNKIIPRMVLDEIATSFGNYEIHRQCP